jgi:hypothetical protein
MSLLRREVVQRFRHHADAGFKQGVSVALQFDYPLPALGKRFKFSPRIFVRLF